jgi:hypothetical protein
MGKKHKPAKFETLRGLGRFGSNLNMANLTPEQHKRLAKLAGGGDVGKMPASQRGLLTALLVQQHNKATP